MAGNFRSQVARLARRTWRSLQIQPKGRDWLELLIAAALLATLAPVGIATGLLNWSPRGLDVLLREIPIVFFAPALGEELLFRGPWIPTRGEPFRALWPIVISTAVFSSWHVVETIWLPKAAVIFLRPDFLVWTAILGTACAVLRHRSGSLWPPVILHWGAVLVWSVWLGGPAGIEALR